MRKLLLIMCMLFPLLGGGEELSKVKTLKKGDRCPEFVFKDTTGKEVSLKQFKGKYVVIDVWASWCSPVQAGVPEFKEIRGEI